MTGEVSLEADSAEVPAHNQPLAEDSSNRVMRFVQRGNVGQRYAAIEAQPWPPGLPRFRISLRHGEKFMRGDQPFHARRWEFLFPADFNRLV